MASPRERDFRGVTRAPSALSRPASVALPPVVHPQPVRPAFRRHHFHDVPPWPHQRYHDYANVEGWGWWPRWFPYWDEGWYAYWWYLYDYYGGDAYPEYAEYARDAVLRQYAPQWGLVVDDYGSDTQVGIQAYGVPSVAHRNAQRGYDPNQTYAYRALALEQARRIQAAVNRTLVGYRDSPWGSELTIFGTRAGLQRWINEQAADADVWYAAAFDLSASSTPVGELAR